MKFTPLNSVPSGLWIKAVVAAPVLAGAVLTLGLILRRKGVSFDNLIRLGKSAVRSRLGLPSASVSEEGAEIWYYRTPGKLRRAVAVRFKDDVVSDVKWIRPPA